MADLSLVAALQNHLQLLWLNNRINKLETFPKYTKTSCPTLVRFALFVYHCSLPSWSWCVGFLLGFISYKLYISILPWGALYWGNPALAWFPEVVTFKTRLSISCSLLLSAYDNTVLMQYDNVQFWLLALFSIRPTLWLFCTWPSDCHLLVIPV